jgi:hypothetical protein
VQQQRGRDGLLGVRKLENSWYQLATVDVELD